MNIQTLTTYLVKIPHIEGYLGNTFRNIRRFNVPTADFYFTVESQTLFNYKIIVYINSGCYTLPTITKTIYIVASCESEFFEKFNLGIKYYYDFPQENYIVI